MSEPREVEITIGHEDFTKLPVAEQRARIARVFDRNLSIDKLKVDLPPDVYGEWRADDPISLKESESVGFKVDDKYAPSSTAFKSNRHIDAVFMTMPMSTKKLIDEVKAEEFNRVHNPKKKGGKIADQIEDRHSGADASLVGLPLISESTTTQVSGEQISHSLSSKT